MGWQKDNLLLSLQTERHAGTSIPENVSGSVCSAQSPANTLTLKHVKRRVKSPQTLWMLVYCTFIFPVKYFFGLFCRRIPPWQHAVIYRKSLLFCFSEEEGFFCSASSPQRVLCDLIRISVRDLINTVLSNQRWWFHYSYQHKETWTDSTSTRPLRSLDASLCSLSISIFKDLTKSYKMYLVN